MNKFIKALISGLVLAVVAAPVGGHAHPKGLYDSQEQAEQRAKELGCEGTHRNNDKWMPCSNEAALHQHLRHH
ncbi:DUF3721 domain-containing protein [Cyanobium sp. ATX 6E8]|jgi:hypothetical protein|uniref:DUF3721 domain-containing protein n=1 Tax=Cyanobium sp. ATX 6E8 TaxID=2823701 RepID=UPI0020CD4DEB|nr:DUF3721 domain-containing protein [Cyanobium sp. ATX 6E8]MCP9943344.1 DUF3721 domain-containing protein [Cyanobium sp. ATX 6E8]